MNEVRKIKGLKSQLKNLKTDCDVLANEIKIKQKDLANKRSIMKSLQSTVNELEKDKSIKVSEHAIVRYFERVKGYNIEEIEKEILSENVLGIVNVLGCTGSYPNKDFKVFMKNFTVTTIH